MAATTKLTYLNYRGRAELIRFILAQAAVDYEDNRIEPEKWAEVMQGIPFGIPVLECPGNRVQGNGTIANFLAEKYNLAGSDQKGIEATREIIELAEKTWDKVSKVFWEKDATKKAEAEKDLIESFLPMTLKKFEEMVMTNNSEKGWIIGQNATYADFAIAVLLDPLSNHKPHLLSVFPALAKLKASVEELPNIKQWIAKRPDTTD